MNAFFSSAVSNLNIPEYCGIKILAERISHLTLKAILKYKNQPEATKKLNPRKSTQSTDIPIKFLKENADIFASYLCGFFNQSIENFEFPSILKNANITPVFKKGYRGSKENYRPVSILQGISKIFEKLFCKQITILMDPLLSKY